MPWATAGEEVRAISSRRTPLLCARLSIESVHIAIRRTNVDDVVGDCWRRFDAKASVEAPHLRAILRVQGMTLGLGVGAREDDFIAAGVKNYKQRGKYFEEQISEMSHVWSGKPWDENTGSVGPAPVQSGGPEIILGGVVPTVFKRVARLANGLVTPLNNLDLVAVMFQQVEQAWQEASRPGKPRLIAQIDIGLETPHNDTAIEDVLSYYKITPPLDVYKSSTLIRTDQQLRDKLKAAEQLGTDEVVLFT